MKSIIFSLLTLLIPIETFSKFTYKYPSSKKLKIDSGILAYCMTKEISKYEKAKIHPAPMYKCNKLWAKKVNNGSDPDLLVAVYDREMLDQYLQISAKRFCDYETGKETELRTWVLNQKDNSIDHIKIFAKALEISNGKVYDALLMIHQLLRNEGRYWSTKYYAYDSNSELEEKFWNKFIDIRGELPERDPNLKADHAGSWYRMWGMMLNRIADTREALPDEKNCGEDIWMISREAATLWNDVVAVGAEAIKPVLRVTGSYNAGSDMLGKTQINLAGNDVASLLDDYFSGKKFTDKRYQQVNCDKSPYLISIP
jgi:hypothetical protein